MQIMLRVFGAKGFSKILLQTEGSKAYVKFCEKVYGRYLCQFNMVDEDQLQKLISLIGNGKGKKILDLGCGSGYISEYIAQETGASIIGIDFAKGAIKSAQNRIKKNDVEFSVGNINELRFPDESFDYVLTIDTLYFGSDIGKIVKNIKSILKPNGKLITFYSSKKEDLNKSGPECTGLGKILDKEKIKYEYWDYTENEKRVWENSLKEAEELKQEFISEGNLEIYKGRVAEAKKNLIWQSKGEMVRYLYYVNLN